jgi:hypothetical protein
VAQEERGGEWRADVHATRRHAQIAFEVQWNRQTLAATRARQKKYARDGVMAYWFFANLPKGAPVDPELPLFKLSASAPDTFAVDLGYARVTLAEAVKALLSGHVRMVGNVRVSARQSMRILFCERTCHLCKKSAHFYAVDGGYKSSCGYEFTTPSGQEDEDLGDSGEWDESEECDESEDATEYEFVPEIIAAASLHAASAGIKLGQVKPRYSKMVGGSYLSFGCYWCDALWGEYYLHVDRMYARMGRIQASHVLEALVEVPQPAVVSLQHWCYPRDADFCDGVPGQYALPD